MTRIIGLAAAAVVVLTVGSVRGDDFSIESRVYDGRELLSRSTTLFAGGKAYDFLAAPDETIVSESASERIQLLDNGRRVRTTLTMTQVGEFCTQLQQRGRANASELVRFMADPQFSERLDPETNELVLMSPTMEYRARMIAPSGADALRQYGEFARRQTMLNAVINPGSPPPFARLKLNEALAGRQMLPQRVSMRRAAVGSEPGRSLRAEHDYTWRLGEPDRVRIAEAERRLAEYREVPVEEYLRPLVSAARR